MILDKNIKKWIYFIVVLVIILAGAALRIYIYSFGRSFWGDEAALANNLLDPNTILNNMSYNQAAPPLFKLISLLALKFAGLGDYTEYALRLFPLICGIAAIPLFFLLADKILLTRLAKTVAVSLFSINYMLIYYSSEFKQYSSDMFITLLLITLTAYFNPFICSKRCLVAFAAVFAGAFWFSHSALFVLAGLFLWSFFYFEPSRRFFVRLLTLYLPSLISFIAFYFLHLKTVSNNEFMHNFWAFYFITDFSAFIRNVHIYLEIVFDPNLNSTLILILIVVGAVALYVQNAKKASLLIFPIMVLLTASALALYPFVYRLCLFILPLLLLLISKMFDFVSHKNIILSLLIACVFYFSFNGYFSQYMFTITREGCWMREEIRPLFNYLKAVIEPGDTIVLTTHSVQQNKFYQKIYKFKNEELEILPFKNDEYTDESFSQLKPKKRYWIVFTRHGNKKKFLDPIDSWISKNARVLDQYVYYSCYLFYIEPLDK